jgi:hypothetical protein
VLQSEIIKHSSESDDSISSEVFVVISWILIRLR